MNTNQEVIKEYNNFLDKVIYTLPIHGCSDKYLYARAWGK